MEPLENRIIKSSKVTNGVLEDVPALHKTWINEHKQWMTLTSLQESHEVWQEKARFVLEDLDFLLELEYHKFWSWIIYDNKFQEALETWLQHLPRDYEQQDMQLEDEVKKLLSDIMHKLFLVLVRMATFKESKENFMTADYFGRLIYDYFVFDIPKVLDICVIFRPYSTKMVEQMMSNIFKCQRSYFHDLRQTIQTTFSTMDSLYDRVDVLVQMSENGSLEQIRELSDVIAYVLDITKSLEAFMLSYPPCCDIFHSCRFEQKLGSFYQNVIVTLCRFVFRICTSKALSESDGDKLILNLAKARKASVIILRQIIQTVCINNLFENIPDTKKKNLESFFDITSTCLSEGTLIVDYAKLYPLQEDLDIFAQCGMDIDNTRVEYIQGGINALRSEMENLASNVEATTLKPIPIADSQDATAATVTPAIASETKEKGDDITALIRNVKDLLPDLGDGSVEACLKYFDNDPEKVINSLLEENLPPHLIEMDRTLTMQQTIPVEVSDGPVRLNVFDNDEFDINRRDTIDLSKVHKGKKNIAKNASELLDDKSHLEGLRDRFAALGIVTDEVIITPGSYDAGYDDEYDDTYDDNAVGQNEPDAKDDLTERRPFVLPRALGGGHVGKTIVLDDSDGSDENEDVGKNFLRNPAEIREENERRRQSQQSRKEGKGSNPRPPPSRDVVGNPKGQGQDKKVLINRAHKNTNKGKHHRAMADKKQSKGMF